MGRAPPKKSVDGSSKPKAGGKPRGEGNSHDSVTVRHFERTHSGAVSKNPVPTGTGTGTRISIVF
jgi:hypothetical protein